MKVGVKKLLRAGMVPARNWVSSCSGDSSNGKIQIEETYGSSSSRKKGTASLSLFMEAYGLEIEEELSTVATQYFWMGKRYHEQREAWM